MGAPSSSSSSSEGSSRCTPRPSAPALLARSGPTHHSQHLDSSRNKRRGTVSPSSGIRDAAGRRGVAVDRVVHPSRRHLACRVEEALVGGDKNARRSSPFPPRERGRLALSTLVVPAETACETRAGFRLSVALESGGVVTGPRSLRPRRQLSCFRGQMLRSHSDEGWRRN